MSVPLISPFATSSFLAQGVSVRSGGFEAPLSAAQGQAKNAPQAQQAAHVQQISNLLSSETISAVHDAEKIGSMDTGINKAAPEAPTAGQAAKEKFLAYMQMRPEELFFTLKLEAKLKEMGMTMEQFEALPPEEQDKIIAEVKAEIQEEARRRAENKIEEARLAHSAQQAAKDLSPESSTTAEDEEENISELEKLAMRLAENNQMDEKGIESLDFSKMTRAEIAKAGNDLFRNGEITLEELFRFEHPDGRLRIGVDGQPVTLNPNDPIDFVAETKQAIKNMEETGDAWRSPRTYEMLQSIYEKISKFTAEA